MTDLHVEVELGATAKAVVQGDLLDGVQRAAVDAAGPFLQRKLQDATPQGATSLLRSSTVYDRTTFMGKPAGFVGPSGAASRYAYWVEEGRKPGKMPPEAPIAYWVRRVLRPPADELGSVTYLVRRAIGKKGTKATHYIRETADAHRKRAQLLMKRAALLRIKTNAEKGAAA